MRILPTFLLILLGVFLGISPMPAQEAWPEGYRQAVEQKLVSLEQKVDRLDTGLSAARTAAAASGLLSFLFGAFCALWAQNTNRNAILWFFLGVFFHVITVIVLLIKNSNDRETRRRQRVFEQRVNDR